jgi:DUF4097 and DUF4098 domain-containing protein YvlB
MPVFQTPQPISVTVSILHGDVRISAGDRTATEVEVRPARAGGKADARVAEQTRVDYADGRLSISTPKQLSSWFGRTGSITVTVKVPVGSSLGVDTGMGELRGEGAFGEVRFRTGYGDLHLDRGGHVHLSTGYGNVSVGQADSEAYLTTGGGSLRVNRVDGPATVKNAAGEAVIGEIAGDLRVKNAHGDILIRKAAAGATVKTAHGTVRIAEVASGSIVAETAFGDLEIGISPGTAAWLDLHTATGRVFNHLQASAGPPAGGKTVEVRARTSYGDIVVRRSEG